MMNMPAKGRAYHASVTTAVAVSWLTSISAVGPADVALSDSNYYCYDTVIMSSGPSIGRRLGSARRYRTDIGKGNRRTTVREGCSARRRGAPSAPSATSCRSRPAWTGGVGVDPQCEWSPDLSNKSILTRMA